MLNIAMGILGKRISGKLEPILGNDVVPSGKLRFNAEFPAGCLNHLQLLFQIIALRGYQKRKIQIAQIMVHGSASGSTSGQKASLLLQKLGFTLTDGVLVAANNYRMIILPEIKHHVAGLDFVCQIFLHSQISPGVPGVGLYKIIIHVASPPCRSFLCFLIFL